MALLETEYLRRVTRAELDWIDEVRTGLGDGTLTWSREQLRAAAAAVGRDGGTGSRD